MLIAGTVLGWGLKKKYIYKSYLLINLNDMFLKEIKPKIKINKNDLYKWNINSVNYKEKEKQQMTQAPFLSNE